MIKKYWQEIASLIFLNIIVIYYPVLDFVKSNGILKQYFGLTPANFTLIFASLFFIPLLLSFLVTRFVKYGFNIIVGFYSMILACGLMTQMGVGLSIIPVIFIILLNIGLVKKKENVVWVLSILGTILFLDSLYKTHRTFSWHFKQGWYSYEQYAEEIKALEKKENAPKHVLFILLDGTDLTTSYLDPEKLPDKSMFPNMHKLAKSGVFFPNAVTNAPQTYASVPIIFTGVKSYPKANIAFQNGRTLLHILEGHYSESKAYAFKNYYQSYCDADINRCYPFKNEADDNELVSILWSFYLYNHSFKQTTLPIKLGNEFEPDGESFEFETFLKDFNKLDTNKTSFHFVHIFRREHHKIKEFDLELGKILETLENKNLLDDTLIAVFSDHGMDMHEKEKKKYGFKSPQNSSIIKVPIFLSYPKSLNHQVPRKIVQNADLFSTILNLVFKPNKMIESNGQDMLSPEYQENLDSFYNCDPNGTLVGLKDRTSFILSKCK
jgi:hypothetical protein